VGYTNPECQEARNNMMNSPIYHRINKQIHKTNGMTYTLAIKCADGVMLAADTKFTVNGGSDYVYGHKITGEITGVLTAFAGSREPFEEFRIRLREYTSEPIEKRNRLDQLWIRIKEIMRTLDNHYSSFKFDVLVGVSTSVGTELHYFYQDGRSEIVDKYKAIGSGAPYGMVYLKTHWRKDIFMDEAADLAYFIIRYIEKFKLDLTVGTGDEFPNPLIRFVTPRHLEEISKVEPTKNDYARYENNAKIRLEKIQKSIIGDYKI
jgi:20S proteasome alpha/beta subunit